MSEKTAPQPDDAAEEPEIKNEESPAPPIQEAGSAEEWKKRSAGWQRTAQAKDEELKRLREQLLERDNTINELQQQINELTLKASSVEKRHQELETRLQATAAESTQAQTALQRMKILMDYPAILPMRDMLRTDFENEEEYRQYLQDFSNTVNKLSNEGAKQMLVGSTPANAGGGQRETPELTADEIYDRLMAGQISDPAERERLMRLLATSS
jgi:chromosome segregation ATPase